MLLNLPVSLWVIRTSLWDTLGNNAKGCKPWGPHSLSVSTEGCLYAQGVYQEAEPSASWICLAIWHRKVVSVCFWLVAGPSLSLRAARTPGYGYRLVMGIPLEVDTMVFLTLEKSHRTMIHSSPVILVDSLHLSYSSWEPWEKRLPYVQKTFQTCLLFTPFTWIESYLKT